MLTPLMLEKRLDLRVVVEIGRGVRKALAEGAHRSRVKGRERAVYRVARGSRKRGVRQRGDGRGYGVVAGAPGARDKSRGRQPGLQCDRGRCGAARIEEILPGDAGRIVG